MKAISPIEKLFGLKPDYQSLKAFGCLRFSYLRPYNSHKLDFRSSPFTFLGYATKKKGYMCLDSKGKIVISRHVVFNERVFPFTSAGIKTTQKAYNSNVIPPILVYSNVWNSKVDKTTEELEPQHIMFYKPGHGSEGYPNQLSQSLVYTNDQTQSISKDYSNSQLRQEVDNNNQVSTETSQLRESQFRTGHHMLTRSKSEIFKPKI